MLKILAVLLSGILYHIKGLGWKTNFNPFSDAPSAHWSRAVCLIGTGLAAAFSLWAFNHTFEWWVYLFVAVGTGAADAKGHSKGIVFGSPLSPVPPAIQNTTWLSFRILLQTGALSGAATMLVLLYEGFWMTAILAMAAFCLKPLCYYLAWRIPSKIYDFEEGPPLGECLHGLTRAVWIFI